MREFIEELENNQKINLEKGLENRVDIDYVIERLKNIIENNKGFDELREQSLEDVYNVLYKNRPHRNSKKYKEWSHLESIAYEELLEEDERPHDCTKIINEIVDYLEKEWKKCNHI